MAAFTLTYDIVTHESAEHGEYAESGFYSSGGWHTEDRPEPEDLHSAVDMMGRGSCEDAGRWFTQVDGSINYQTGEDERRSVHPPQGITPSSYRRLRRIFCGGTR